MHQSIAVCQPSVHGRRALPLVFCCQPLRRGDRPLRRRRRVCCGVGGAHCSGREGGRSAAWASTGSAAEQGMQPERAGRAQPANRQVHGSCQATSPACTHPCLAPRPPFRLRTVDVMRLLSIAGLSGGLPGVAIGAAAGSCWRGRSMTAAWAMPPQPPALAAPGAAWPRAGPPASGHQAGSLNGAHSRHAGSAGRAGRRRRRKVDGSAAQLVPAAAGAALAAHDPAAPGRGGCSESRAGGQAASSRARPSGADVRAAGAPGRCKPLFVGCLGCWDRLPSCWAAPHPVGRAPTCSRNCRVPLPSIGRRQQSVACGRRAQATDGPRPARAPPATPAEIVSCPESRLRVPWVRAGRSVALWEGSGASARQLGACCGFGQHAAAGRTISPNSQFCSCDHSVAAPQQPPDRPALQPAASHCPRAPRPPRTSSTRSAAMGQGASRAADDDVFFESGVRVGLPAWRPCPAWHCCRLCGPAYHAVWRPPRRR